MRGSARGKFPRISNWVRRMALSLEEARSLAGLFGELDRKKMLLLLLFDKPGSKWDRQDDVKKLPKSDRISTATLYRNVDELRDGGFLEEMKGSERRGRSGTTVQTYRLTFKGYIAEAISAHLLLLERKTSPQLGEEVERIAKGLESTPGWPVLVEFLKYHRDMEIDLSRVSIDSAYFATMLSLALSKHSPEDISSIVEPSFKQLGVDFLPIKAMITQVQKLHAEMEESGDSFMAKLARMKLESKEDDLATKVGKSRKGKMH
jgi:hypothetical protein